MMQGGANDHTCHICLVGRSVSNNWSLIESLKRGNQVTIIEPLGLLYHSAVILSTVSVLILDCGEGSRMGIEALRVVRGIYPDLCVVLVNGGLTQNEIAEAFEVGVRDYFSYQDNVLLLVERVQHLCRQRQRESRMRAAAMGGESKTGLPSLEEKNP